MAEEPRSAVVLPWFVNPFRGDQFAEAWTPHAAAAMRYGASGWALLRSADDPLRFTQISFFEDHADWDRYWYGDEMAAAREEILGLFQVPLQYTWQHVIGIGSLEMSHDATA
jgi:hypothetical protein